MGSEGNKEMLTMGQETNRPLIFIAHSLGGIVVKQVSSGQRS